MSELHKIIRDAQPISGVVDEMVNEIIETIKEEFKKEDLFYQMTYVNKILDKLTNN